VCWALPPQILDAMTHTKTLVRVLEGCYVAIMQPKRGEFKDVVVPSGQTEHVQGAVEGAHIEAGGALTVQGALAGIVHVAGALLAQGAFAGEITVAANGTAILQGVITAHVRNEGIVVIESQPEGFPVDLVNVGGGRSATVDELPAHIRGKLPTVTTSGAA